MSSLAVLDDSFQGARVSLTIGHFLGQSAWVEALPSALRCVVMQEAYETHHIKGQVVALQGTAVHSWLGVRSGLLKIRSMSGKGKSVMFTGVPAGSWVGEGSVIKEEARRYDVVAMRDSYVVHIPRRVFHHLLDTQPSFDRHIIGILNERLAQYIGMVESDRFANPIARLARSILSLLNPVLYPGAGPKLYVSQEEFGELAGLSRQTTNSSMKILERAGLVQVHYGFILVLDTEGLAKFSQIEQ